MKEMEKLAKQHDLTKDNVVRRRVVEELITEGQPKAVAKFARGSQSISAIMKVAKLTQESSWKGQLTTRQVAEHGAGRSRKTLAEQLEQLQDKDTRITLLGFVGDRPAVKF